MLSQRTDFRSSTTIVMLLMLCLAVDAGERVVLLRNGNLIRGDAAKQLDDVVVVRTKQSVLRIPVSEVDYVADSIDVIYRRKSKSAKRPSQIESLVTWCLQQGLVGEAQTELQRLRKAAPAHPSLKSLQRSLTRRQSNGQGNQSSTLLPGKSPLHPDTQYAKDHIASLSSESLRGYARVVQPLLLNRCAIAGCHGKAPKSKYQMLGRGHSAVAQNLTHRNLGATLRQIDAPAKQSLLWVSASQLHGGMTRPLKQDEANRLLFWIHRASQELGVENARTRGSVRQASAEVALDGVDPFDPAEFNAMHERAGETAGK